MQVEAGSAITWKYSHHQVAECLEIHGFTYLNFALCHPPVSWLLDLRMEMGIQNLFHQVARMLNPARAVSQINRSSSVFRKTSGSWYTVSLDLRKRVIAREFFDHEFHRSQAVVKLPRVEGRQVQIRHAELVAVRPNMTT